MIVIAASLFLPTSGLATKSGFDDGSVALRAIAASRVYGAALVLAPVVIRARLRLDRRDWLTIAVFAVFAVFGISVPQRIYFKVIKRIPVPIALIIVYTARAIVTVFERTAHHRCLASPVYLRSAWPSAA